MASKLVTLFLQPIEGQFCTRKRLDKQFVMQNNWLISKLVEGWSKTGQCLIWASFFFDECAIKLTQLQTIFPSYRNQWTDLRTKVVGWFLFNDLPGLK